MLYDKFTAIWNKQHVNEKLQIFFNYSGNSSLSIAQRRQNIAESRSTNYTQLPAGFIGDQKDNGNEYSFEYFEDYAFSHMRASTGAHQYYLLNANTFAMIMTPQA